MTDQPFPDRVTQLRRRWEADRTSRLFLQLAEEYRQLGRLRESVEVLDAGLVEHPGYLSALVAKGRCHLELDEPQAAREALERVVRQDATQAVASKLLVRAYLDLGELARARERLSLYALLHETDPDIAELRRRLEAPDPAPPAAVVAASGTHDQPRADPVGTEAANPARSDAMNEDIFDLGVPPRHSIPMPPSDDLFGLYQEPRSFGAGEIEDDEIFAGLGGQESRRRWAEGLAFGGIFDLRVLDLPPFAPIPVANPIAPSIAPPVVASQAQAPVAPQAPMYDAVPAPVPVLGFERSLAAAVREPAPAAPEPVKASPRAVDLDETVDLAASSPSEHEVESETETVTLAELYLRQGHRDEALRMLDHLLRREPDNRAASDLAARIRAGSTPQASIAQAALISPEPAPEPTAFVSPPESVAAPVTPVVPAAPVAVAAPVPPLPPAATKTRRKVQFLTAYLERLRRGSAPGVS